MAFTASAANHYRVSDSSYFDSTNNISSMILPWYTGDFIEALAITSAVTVQAAISAEDLRYSIEVVSSYYKNIEENHPEIATKLTKYYILETESYPKGEEINHAA